MFNLLRDNKKQKYAIIDGESCNLNLGDLENKSWQWGILDCKGEEIIQSHDLLIKWPKLNVSKEAAKHTRFSQDNIDKHGIEPKRALDILDSYIYNPEYKLIIHNGLGFDVYLHNIFRRNLGLKTDYSYIYRILDTNCLAKGIKLGIKYEGKNEKDLLMYQYKLFYTIQKGLKTNLTLLGKENEIDVNYDELHNSLNDVILLKLVWNKYIKWRLEI